MGHIDLFRGNGLLAAGGGAGNIAELSDSSDGVASGEQEEVKALMDPNFSLKPPKKKQFFLTGGSSSNKRRKGRPAHQDDSNSNNDSSC
jgi:hypothetical protein